MRNDIITLLLNKIGYKTLYILDAQAFYNHLKTQNGYLGGQLIEKQQITAVHQFCSLKAPKTIFGKIRAVKVLVKSLITSGLIPPIKLKFKLFGKGLASMLDKGALVFYRQFLFRQAYCESVLTVLHEIAHVKLWAEKDYEALKKCDAEFLTRYVKDASCTVVCPVEYYANVLALTWLGQAVEQTQNKERAEKLKVQAELLTTKLNNAKEKI